MKNKIIWKKPYYKNEYSRVSDKEINRLCLSGSETGDVKIERRQYGRKITFIVHRIEKIGELVEGIDTLSRTRAIEELKILLKKEKKSKSLLLKEIIK